MIWIAKAALFFALVSAHCFACAQIEEPLSNSAKALLQSSISDKTALTLAFTTEDDKVWLNDMSHRLEKHIPDKAYREDLLRTVHFEASRAGLDPQLVLSLIQVASGFKKYALSPKGARGFMQVMPFWARNIGASDHNLFLLRTNLRYGCTILRHYIDIEHGDLYRALGRYNGSLGQPEYPDMVLGVWHKNWNYSQQISR